MFSRGKLLVSLATKKVEKSDEKVIFSTENSASDPICEKNDNVVFVELIDSSKNEENNLADQESVQILESDSIQILHYTDCQISGAPLLLPADSMFMNLDSNCNDCGVTVPFGDQHSCQIEIPCSSRTCTAVNENLEELEIGNGDGALKKRNRVRKTSSWKKSEAKRLRCEGEEYMGYRRENNVVKHDKPRAARQLGAPCTSVECIRRKTHKCSHVTEDQRQQIFKQFWKQTNWDQRKTFVVNHVEVKPTTKSYTQGKSRRSNTFKYYLTVDGDKLEVCKQLFLSTIGLGEFTVLSWLKNNLHNSGMSNCIEFDNSNHKTTINTKHTRKTDFATEYLKDLPKLESHYGRRSSSKLYLEDGIRSMQKLYDLYCESCKSKEEEVISRCSFTNIFNKLNLSIHPIKKDKCDTFVKHEVGQLSAEEYRVHVVKKNRARVEKEQDKQNALNNKCIAFTMDLQAVKVSPWVQASAIFYKTKLCCHNFTMFNLSSREVCCYWFDETASDLTASTFTTCVLEYLETYCMEAECPIILYSDGCVYQNRNSTLANALLSFAVDNKKEVIQKFLVSGHTQMECDSVHATIERTLRGQDIYLPQDYIKVTKVARKKPFPYVVRQMTYSDFKDYTVSKYQRYSSIRPGKIVNDPVVMHLRALRYLPTGVIEYKLDFDSEWTPLPQRVKHVSEVSCWPPMYEEERSIPKKKWDHLQELKKVIPREYHHYYDNLKYH